MTFSRGPNWSAHVKKSAKGSLVVHANAIPRTGRMTTARRPSGDPLPKTYPVFNVEQIDRLPEQYYGKPEKQRTPVERFSRNHSKSTVGLPYMPARHDPLWSGTYRFLTTSPALDSVTQNQSFKEPSGYTLLDQPIDFAIFQFRARWPVRVATQPSATREEGADRTFPVSDFACSRQVRKRSYRKCDFSESSRRCY